MMWFEDLLARRALLRWELAVLDAQIAAAGMCDAGRGITFADVRADHEAELEMLRALRSRGTAAEAA